MKWWEEIVTITISDPFNQSEQLNLPKHAVYQCIMISVDLTNVVPYTISSMDTASQICHQTSLDEDGHLYCLKDFLREFAAHIDICFYFFFLEWWWW